MKEKVELKPIPLRKEKRRYHSHLIRQKRNWLIRGTGRIRLIMSLRITIRAAALYYNLLWHSFRYYSNLLYLKWKGSRISDYVKGSFHSNLKAVTPTYLYKLKLAHGFLPILLSTYRIWVPLGHNLLRQTGWLWEGQSSLFSFLLLHWGKAPSRRPTKISLSHLWLTLTRPNYKLLFLAFLPRNQSL